MDTVCQHLFAGIRLLSINLTTDNRVYSFDSTANSRILCWCRWIVHGRRDESNGTKRIPTNCLDRTCIRPGGTMSEGPDERSRIGSLQVLQQAIQSLIDDKMAILVPMAAGAVLAAIEGLRRWDPIPVTDYVGVQELRFAISLDVPVAIAGTTTTELNAVGGLRAQWFVWLIILQLVGFLVSVGAGLFVLSSIRAQPITRRTAGRYVVFVFLVLLLSVQLDVKSVWIAISLFGIGAFVFVRLFLVPGLIVDGVTIRGAIQQSWRRTQGYGWTILAIFTVLGFGHHLLLSIPLVGPIGSGLIVSIHAATIGVILERTAHSGTENTRQ